MNSWILYSIAAILGGLGLYCLLRLIAASLDKTDCFREDKQVHFFFLFVLCGLSAAFIFYMTWNLDTAAKTIKQEAKQEKQKIKQEKSKLNTALHNNYTVYVDDKVVEAENIDFSFYKITIDTEKKKILCTRK